MFNKYPYTDFHELNLDYILDLCRRTMGLHLETSGDFLKLVNQAGEDVSKLKVTYADKALTDMDGHDIRAFILDAGVDGRRLVFDRGNGEYISITVPYATSAEQDVNGVSITDYVKNVSVSGDNVLITFGNGSTVAITVPFATKANTDINGKSLTTYVAELSTGNDKLIVKDGDGVTLAELTIPYAVKARNDYDGDDIRTTYGTDLTVGQTTVILRDKETNVLSEITVPYAVSAQTDNNGAPFRSSYGSGLTTGSNKVQLTAPNGTVLSDITVPFASTATDATNAIESVTVSGDNIVFTTYGGQSFSITCPYAVKALKDDLNNTLSHTYIANAVNDPLTGKITFYAQDGAVIAEMTPTVDRATHDNLGNDISDYIKSIVTDPNSNYVTVTHGDGTADSLTINYATKAWKDTYGNVIGNVYIRSLSIITDSNTGKKVLVAYNGELSELFRIDLDSETAVNDINGTPITDYVVDVTLNGTDLDIEHGDGTVDSITLPSGGAQVLNDLTDVTITSPSAGDVLTYWGGQFINRNPHIAGQPVMFGSLSVFGDVPAFTPVTNPSIVDWKANYNSNDYYVSYTGGLYLKVFAVKFEVTGGVQYNNVYDAITSIQGVSPAKTLTATLYVCDPHNDIFMIVLTATTGDFAFTLSSIDKVNLSNKVRLCTFATDYAVVSNGFNLKNIKNVSGRSQFQVECTMGGNIVAVEPIQVKVGWTSNGIAHLYRDLSEGLNMYALDPEVINDPTISVDVWVLLPFNMTNVYALKLTGSMSSPILVKDSATLETSIYGF